MLARLRHQRFFSLEELNGAIRPLLAELNDRPFQRLPGSRRSVFEALDRPAMRALPATRTCIAEWKERTVAFDYHVDVERHYYSVPHALVGHGAWARFTRRDRGGVLPQPARGEPRALLPARRAHDRAPSTCRSRTGPTPSGRRKRLIQWGASIGSEHRRRRRASAALQAPPEQGYRACLGLLSLSASTGWRLEAASALAVRLRQPHPQECQVDPRERPRWTLRNRIPGSRVPIHGNVRGPGYYH